jgi:hypothetical protein
MFWEAITQKPTTRQQITVTFDAKGAHVLVDDGGKRSTKDVPLIEAAPRANLSEFWFIRDTPKLDQTVKFYHFDVSKLDWEVREATYKGRAGVVIEGKAITGHKVVGTSGTTFIDDHGIPIKIEAPTVTFERIMSAAPSKPSPKPPLNP